MDFKTLRLNKKDGQTPVFIGRILMGKQGKA